MAKKKNPKKYNPEKKVKRITAEKRKELNVMIKTMEATKMLSLYVLRNQGWGRDRLKRFSDKFNEYMVDVSDGYFSMSDILGVLEEECGLTLDDLKLPDKREEN